MADVAWASEEFMQNNRGKSPFDEAPEICIEILSPPNTEMEMEEKKELYFATGAKEFWVCNKGGDIKFYKNTGPLEHSNIVAEFPSKLSV